MRSSVDGREVAPVSVGGPRAYAIDRDWADPHHADRFLRALRTISPAVGGGYTARPAEGAEEELAPRRRGMLVPYSRVTVLYPLHADAFGAGALVHPRRKVREAGERCAGFPGRYGLVGRSVELKRVLDRVERLAASDMPVLILGETGTGKELVARALHEAGPRGAGPFIPVNCAAFPEKDILYTELFGAARGAFTGCTREIVGALEAADEGTLFLDEVSELSPKAQASLLRFLDGGEVKRLGEARARRSEVRLVCATQTRLSDLVRRGSMRPDLYYRIGRSTLVLPPLRERGGDVRLLIDFFLERLSERAEKRITLGGSLRAALTEYHWPGNVRELKSEISALVALAPEEAHLGVDSLSPEILEWLARRKEEGRGGSYRERVTEAEARALRELMRESGWVVARAARRIGMSRNGLSQKLRRLGIERPEEQSE